MKEKVIVEVGYVSKNYSAHIPTIHGCITTGNTLEEIKNNMEAALEFHIEGMLEDGEQIPKFLAQRNYELVLKLSMEAFLNCYSNIFTKAALSRITGINERQLWYYAAGRSKPRPKQIERVEQGVRGLAQQLMEVEL